MRPVCSFWWTNPVLQGGPAGANEPPIGANQAREARWIKGVGVGFSSQGETVMLEVKVERCAGIDVGKKFLDVCVLTAKVLRFYEHALAGHPIRRPDDDR
jgi:hypothetical protein